jgi:GWxTD domain-containing protein
VGRPSFAAEATSYVERDSLKAFAYLEVPVRELFFASREDESFEAVVDITVLIFEKGFQVAGDTWRHRLRAPSLLTARNSSRALRKTIRFPVPPGDYDVEVGISQPEAGTGGKLRLPLKAVRSPKKGLRIAPLLFGVCPGGNEKPHSIRENPLLGRRFGNPLPPVCLYTQVHHPKTDAGEVLQVRWSLETLTETDVRSDTMEIPAGHEFTDVLVPLPLEKLWMGTYSLRLECRLRKWKEEANTTFEMDETRVSLGKEFESTLEMVKIIANEEEIEALESAPHSDRQKAWDDFWKGRDPTPDTERNEFKEEYFRRVRHANEQFGVLEPGWRSDRGRIYIRYGEPDQIESYPQNINSPPHEIWDYFRLRVRFVFVDYEGFGRYELYQPGRPSRSRAP